MLLYGRIRFMLKMPAGPRGHGARTGAAVMAHCRSDRKKLRKFAGTTDRYLTGNFAGREAEITRIMKRIDDVRDRHRSGEIKPAAGATMLIQGAPGAGKTSLIDKLRQDWTEAAEGETAPTSGPFEDGCPPSLPDVASIDAEALNSPAALEADLRRAGQPLRAAHRLASVFSGLQFLGIGVSVDVPKELADQVIRDASRPLVLFIDEIQNAKVDGMAGEFLNRMHSGSTGAPVIPIYAGLAHSRDVLSRAGLTRLAVGAVINLGCLSEEETGESADKFFRMHEVKAAPETKERWKELVWRESCGWPQHLHNTLRSVAEELILDPDGDLEKIDPFAARRRSAAQRADYYAARMRGGLARARVLLGRVMEAISDGRDEAACINLIDSLHQPGDRATAVPRGMEAEDFFDLMIARGLLQESVDEAGVYCAPIPSMRNWCVAVAGGVLHTAVAAGDIEAVLDCLKSGDDFAARDARGRTPLHIAVEENWPEIAEMLLDAGADPQAQDNNGVAAADAADPLSDTARLFHSRSLL